MTADDDNPATAATAATIGCVVDWMNCNDKCWDLHQSAMASNCAALKKTFVSYCTDTEKYKTVRWVFD